MDRAAVKKIEIIVFNFSKVGNDTNGNSVAAFRGCFNMLYAENNAAGYEFSSGARRVQTGGKYESNYKHIALQTLRASHFSEWYNFSEWDAVLSYNRAGTKITGCRVEIRADLKSKKEIMYYRIEQHGAQLRDAFGGSGDAVALCKKLLRVENKMHRLALDNCNFGSVTDEQWSAAEKSAVITISALLPRLPLSSLVFNADPRGYALKIKDGSRAAAKISYKDWGGFAIIAPTFDGEL